jgi:hypothetical protein
MQFTVTAYCNVIIGWFVNGRLLVLCSPAQAHFFMERYQILVFEIIQNLENFWISNVYLK